MFGRGRFEIVLLLGGGATVDSRRGTGGISVGRRRSERSLTLLSNPYPPSPGTADRDERLDRVVNAVSLRSMFAKLVVEDKAMLGTGKGAGG